MKILIEVDVPDHWDISDKQDEIKHAINYERWQQVTGEPVAWIYKPHKELLWPHEVEKANPIELDEYCTTPNDFARAIEAALKEQQ